MSRPGTRSLTLAAFLGGAVLLSPAPAAMGEVQRQEVFEIVPLAEGVYAAVVLPRPPAYAFANSLVVVGDEGVLVVDTQQSPAAARALIAEIEGLTDRPVRWVVNTHWHGDHVYGNQAYVEAFPRVRFVAAEATRERMAGEGRERWRRELEELPPSIETRREWLRTGRGPDGASLSPADRTSVERSVALRSAYLEELRSLRLALPDVTFTSALTLHLGDRPVRLLALGPAHTTGDVAVYLPDEGILAAGDLVEEGIPYLDRPSMSGWADALEHLTSLEVRHLLPGHGGVHHDADLLRWQAALFRALVDRVEALRREGAPPGEILESVTLDSFAEEFEAVGVSGERFRAWVREAVEHALGDADRGS